MEFLGRSWSVSSVEISKALSHTCLEPKHLDNPNSNLFSYVDGSAPLSEEHQQPGSLAKEDSPPVSPRKSDEMKLQLNLLQELFLIHQALNQDFVSSHQLLKNGLYRNIMRGRTMGRWMKDQKERRKHEVRTHNAQLHAAVSVAGVAAAVAALTASLSTNASSNKEQTARSKASNAVASAAALVASHCIEIAEDMGAEHEQILSAVNSATTARTNGDIMTLTAGAATALRGAATLRARLQKGATTMALGEEQGEEGKDVNALAALNFVFKGGELLKLTRKGDLHWKQISFKVNTKWQVVAKMKSKHMAGTFTKKKKCVVSGVYDDVPAWPGREVDDSNEQRQYFGIETSERIIQFECSNKDEKQKWIEGLQHLLNCRANMAWFT
ncbi:hypothetical protein OSB04_029761 [Centaurea solstitialis]|uniref:PH domain-containing protein n=1 Tax=Centaurea solstitialis TaxID=347529 RepID=A0AA38S749_9ASTR|nr:hypothetical protein OSB04_029761 [Centaurea solstitialis]